MSSRSNSIIVLKKLNNNNKKIKCFLSKPIEEIICVLFSYHRIHDFITVINNPVTMELVLNSLIIVTDKKCKAVRTLPTNWEIYTPPVNRNTQNDGWHYNEEWLFHNALAEYCIPNFFKPMEGVFHIYANHPTLLLQDRFLNNPTYSSMITFFDYIDVMHMKCPEFLLPCYTYYKKVCVYLRKYDHFLHLFFLRKSLPIELNSVIMSYL